MMLLCDGRSALGQSQASRAEPSQLVEQINQANEVSDEVVETALQTEYDLNQRLKLRLNMRMRIR